MAKLGILSAYLSRLSHEFRSDVKALESPAPMIFSSPIKFPAIARPIRIPVGIIADSLHIYGGIETGVVLDTCSTSLFRDIQQRKRSFENKPFSYIIFYGAPKRGGSREEGKYSKFYACPAGLFFRRIFPSLFFRETFASPSPTAASDTPVPADALTSPDTFMLVLPPPTPPLPLSRPFFSLLPLVPPPTSLNFFSSLPTKRDARVLEAFIETSSPRTNFLYATWFIQTQAYEREGGWGRGSG